MELKEFINNTLTQIAEGVQGAIDNSVGRGYLVNPTGNKSGSNYTVHFDLCVTSQKEGGLNIKVADGSLSEKSTNRITFDVDMLLPRPESANAIAAYKRTEKYLDWKKNPVERQDNHEEENRPTLGR